MEYIKWMEGMIWMRTEYYERLTSPFGFLFSSDSFLPSLLSLWLLTNLLTYSLTYHYVK